jgi:diaminohydroxyphosphoribosylaminopyrimidine deaminase/5-amino-6-(5-phosphoribosylamino)uracil reductase
VRFIGTETVDGHIALPELMEDLGAIGMASILVEGGAEIARAFLDDGLVDRIVLFRGTVEIGEGGVVSPIDERSIPDGFRHVRTMRFADDVCNEWTREA